MSILRLLSWKDKPSVAQSLAESVDVKIVLIETENIVEVVAEGTGSKITYKIPGGTKDIHVFENPTQVQANYNLAQTGTLEALQLQLAAAATGSTQGAGVAIAKYYATVSTATDTTAEAIDLPAATVGKVVKVANLTAVALEAFPASTGTINGAAANALYDHAAGGGVYYYCQVAGAYKVATF